jgi:hypothetical protein
LAGEGRRPGVLMKEHTGSWQPVAPDLAQWKDREAAVPPNRKPCPAREGRPARRPIPPTSIDQEAVELAAKIQVNFEELGI